MLQSHLYTAGLAGYITSELMKYLVRTLKTVWWLALAYIPLAQAKIYREFATSIGCPPAGDCYVPGSEHLLGMDILNFFSAVVIWPACLWVLVVHPLLALSKRRARATEVAHDL